MLSVLVGSLEVTASACADMDTSACVLMDSKNGTMCSDPVLARTACQKYCNLCGPLCFHCDSSVTDYHDCTSTRTCASDQLCDGNGIVVVFGKRDVASRDISIHCCSTDLCNHPSQTSGTASAAATTAAATTANAAATTSAPQACKRDIFVLVEVNHGQWSDIGTFLTSLISGLQIGQTGALLSAIQIAPDTANILWTLNQHTDKPALQNATNYLRVIPNNQYLEHAGKNHKRASYDMDQALSYLLTRAMVPAAGDRPDAADVVIFLYEDSFNTHGSTKVLATQLQLHSPNVITIGVHHHGDVGKFEILSTDEGHEFTFDNVGQLMGFSQIIASLICR